MAYVEISCHACLPPSNSYCVPDPPSEVNTEKLLISFPFFQNFFMLRQT